MSTPKSRQREGAGKSDTSWIKHGLAGKAVSAQVAAFRRRFPTARMILVDGNAGDGEGVDVAQGDLFVGSHKSRPTPHLLSDLAKEHGCTLMLCEQELRKRRLLVQAFPDALIVSDHAAAASYVIKEGFNYALWLSDPCGPKGQGVEHMRQVALRILRSDFVIIFNEVGPHRFIGVKHSPYWQKHQKYVPMLQSEWWLEQIPKRNMARTQVIKQSSGFHFRLIVISDFLTDGVKRMRGIEITTRSA
jgi:hypothetical protein